MTSIFTIMFGAMGLGAALSDLGDQQEGIIAAKSIFETIDQGLLSLLVSVIMLLLADEYVIVSPLHSAMSMSCMCLCSESISHRWLIDFRYRADHLCAWQVGVPRLALPLSFPS